MTIGNLEDKNTVLDQYAPLSFTSMRIATQRSIVLPLPDNCFFLPLDRHRAEGTIAGAGNERGWEGHCAVRPMRLTEGKGGEGKG